MKFEIGKTYIHNSGKIMKIIGEATTTFYGDALIGENSDGTLTPVGRLEENAIGWQETKDLVEYLTATDLNRNLW